MAKQRKGPKAFFADSKKTTSIGLTDLAIKISAAAEERTKKSRSEVIEQLLREHGSTVTFPEAEREQEAVGA